MIVAFSVRISRPADFAAKQEGVSIFSSDIIYRVTDEMKQRIIPLLPVNVERRVTGEATVLQLFDIDGKQKKIVKVAGCRVSNGTVEKERPARIVRDGQIIHDGEHTLFVTVAIGGLKELQGSSKRFGISRKT